MKLDLLYPRLPPQIDGVADHTAKLATALASDHQVRVLTGRDQSHASSSFAVRPVLAPGAQGVRLARAAVLEHRPDWLLVQYTGFAYGGVHGINPSLVANVRAVARSAGTSVALLAHEAYAPMAKTAKAALLSAAQRVQFRLLGGAADVVLVSTEVWLQDFTGWFPHARTGLLPVASNLPLAGAERRLVRAQRRIRQDAFVAVTFGGLGAHRDLGLLADGLRAVASVTSDMVGLYVGTDGDRYRAVAEQVGVPAVIVDRPDGQQAADLIASSDMGLAPFSAGVSLRRGSFLALLQHGVPTVTTEGALTGPQLQRAAHDGAFLLARPGDRKQFCGMAADAASSEVLRSSLAAAGARYYARHHGWDAAAHHVVKALVGANSGAVA